MGQIHYKASDAIKEHLIGGNEISLIEAMLLFGVQNLNAELARLRKSGFVIQKKRVPMAKILRRANQFCEVKAPSNLPVREILVTEYWLSNV